MEQAVQPVVENGARCEFGKVRSADCRKLHLMRINMCSRAIGLNFWKLAQFTSFQLY
ncbi:hypothetical protein QUB63_32855 [Microcoleus sp. ARI1-B5]|uniref:hypothetical protein n=1 Tax=unclassified Microcoleus TaxID=2642155 RepID=UPI002FD08F5E